MKKTLPAIALFVLFVYCCHPAAGQYSLNDRLIAAAGRGESAAIQPLLDKGANIEARNGDGETALILAAKYFWTGTVKVLLEKGANIEAKNNGGATALTQAACNDKAVSENEKSNKTDTVKLLVDKGADVDHTGKLNSAGYADPKGEYRLLTALECAEKYGPAEAVDLLAEASRQRKQLKEALLKDPRVQFATGMSAFQQNPKDESLREKVIQLSIGLAEPPPIPEEARQLFLLATSQIQQANTPQALAQPIGLLRKALEISPCWGNAYFNLSRALEMAGQYDDAARQLNYYLELKPAEADAIEARAHLVVIQAEKDAAAHKQ
jgi:tetratricopeptide (TPR) repeat protein